MVIVKIIGGLGNQMFQYSYAKALEQRGYAVKLDISAFKTYRLHGGYQLYKYKIDLDVTRQEENNIFYKILRRLGFGFTKTRKEKNLFFNSNFLNIEDESYVEGYFQSEKYFENIRDTLLNQFVLNDEISSYTKKISEMISKVENSVSIHIRRGDFTNSTNINIHGICSLDYYEKAITILSNSFNDISYFVFSDDIKWAKDNLRINNAVYIASEETRIPHEDIYLMSLCNHNIIANSSFSWWGAWLNQNKKKIVIAPEKWFADDKMQKQSGGIVCKSWITI